MNIIEMSKYAIPYLIDGLGVTAYLALISGILAIIVGIIGGLGATSKVFLIRKIINIYVNVFRSTPFLVQLYVAYFILPSFGIKLNVLVTAIGSLVLYNGAYISEIVRGGIEAIPKEQSEAAFSLGMTPYQTIKLIILPLVIRIIIPPLVGQLITLIKSTSVTSLIGIFDLVKVGRELVIATRFNPFLIYGLVALFYFVICYPLYLFSISLEKKFRLHFDSL